MADLSVEQMRLVVRDAYSGEGWKYRVMHMMKDNQIIAIYRSIENRKARQEKKKEEGHWVQMDFDSYLEERYGKLNNSVV